MKATVQSILTELLKALEKHYGSRLYEVILYGSQARGDAMSDSDIDVLVVLEGAVDVGVEIQAVSGITADLSLIYDQVISCVFVSRYEYLLGQWPLLMNVRAEGVPI